jgi:hypothetical protein
MPYDMFGGSLQDIHSRDKLYLQSFHPPECYSCRILTITSFSEHGSQYQSNIHFLLQVGLPVGSTGNRKIIDFV